MTKVFIDSVLADVHPAGDLCESQPFGEAQFHHAAALWRQLTGKITS